MKHSYFMRIKNAIENKIMHEWLNGDYLELKTIKTLKKSFPTKKPFPHLVLNNLLKEEKAIQILKVLSKEKFYKKESDLFKLSQTNDFLSTNNKILKNFREFFTSEEFISLISYITSSGLKNGIVDMNGSLYQDTDFLLCHDDRLEGRKIAYIYYLSNFKEADGGSLNLFSSKNNMPIKITRKIIPKFNTFAFFEVSPISFHEVEEVIANKQRITINGWFYQNADTNQ